MGIERLNRRQFLKHLGLAALAVIGPAALLQNAPKALAEEAAVIPATSRYPLKLLSKL